MSTNCVAKPACRYGLKCYRKSSAHFEEYSHPSNCDDDNITPKSPKYPGSQGCDNFAVERKRQKPNVEAANASSTSSPKKSNLHERGSSIAEGSWKNKVGFYLTKVRGIEGRWNTPHLAVGIQDILSIDADKFERSFQFNYMVDIGWLSSNYPSENRRKPLTIVYNKIDADDKKFLRDKNLLNINLLAAKLPIAYGTHHTKMMLLFYENGLRVVVHTANLIEQDWDQKTQGAFVSQLLPKIEGKMIDSATNFGNDLIDYLKSYKLPVLDSLCNDLKSYDYSMVRVFLLPSTPGRFLSSNIATRGHLRLRQILKSHVTCHCDDQWPVIGQFSSIGSLGSSADNWLTSEFASSLKSTALQAVSALKQPKLLLVFPCEEDVRLSLEGYPAGASLPYSKTTAEKQPYLSNFFHKWKAESIGRARASPHIKSYCRVNSDFSKMAWFLLSSANLSKAAWGVFEKQKSQLMVRSYELGVLFLPQNFGLSSFELTTEDSFLMPFDLPLIKYSSDDEPWIWDKNHTKKPDSHGNMWIPS